MPNVSRFSDADRAHAGRLYSSGLTTYEVASRIGCSPCHATDLIISAGIAIRNRSDCQRRFPIDHSSFDSLTPSASYWLGFLFADGSVNYNRRQIHLRLSVTDQSHVVAFRDFLKSGASISRYAPRQCRHIKSGEMFAVTITSQQLADRMATYGHRSHNQSDPPAALVQSADFWRGMVDGDGTVGSPRRSANCPARRPILRLVGGQTIMSRFAEFLSPLIAPHVPSIRPQGKIFRIVLTGITAAKALTAIYPPNCFGLPRKVAAAREALAIQAAKATQ